jgi:superoxide dismutase
MNKKVEKEIDVLAKEYSLNLNNSKKDIINEFADNVNWNTISRYPNLSEDFIREFKNEI